MTIVKPSKEQVRQYMQHRRTETTPPVSPERFREMMGWKMLHDAARSA